MKKYLFLFLFIFACSKGFAGNYRAGEITYQSLGGYNYQINIKLIADSGGVDSVAVYFGDGDSGKAQINFPNNSVGIGQASFIHLYPGDGQYYITSLLKNRISGIVNIPNSNTSTIFLQTYLKINSLLGGADNSPIFTNPSFDVAQFTAPIYYNQSALDPDGDSLSYQLSPCNGQSSYPPANNSFTIDSITGNVFWDAPIILGPTNFMTLTKEWRKLNSVYYLIGYVESEIEIVVGPLASVQNILSPSDLSVFPNPSNSDLTISIHSGTIFDDLKLEILDISGREIEVKYEVKDQNIILRRQNLSSGFYIYKLLDKGQYLGAGKFEILESN